MTAQAQGPRTGLATMAAMLWHDRTLPYGYGVRAWLPVKPDLTDMNGTRWPSENSLVLGDSMWTSGTLNGQGFIRVAVTSQVPASMLYGSPAGLLMAVRHEDVLNSSSDMLLVTQALMSGVVDVHAAVAARGARTSLTEADLERANLAGASLRQADLTQANLDRANLQGASLELARLYDAELQYACLYQANLAGASLELANAYSAAFAGASLAGACLRSAYLEYAKFPGADLSGTDLTETDLARAVLTSANLAGVDLSTASLVHAQVGGAKIDNTPANRHALLSNAVEGEPYWLPAEEEQ